MHYLVGTFLLGLIAFLVANVIENETNNKIPQMILGYIGNILMSWLAGYAIFIAYWGKESSVAAENVSGGLICILIAYFIYGLIVYVRNLHKSFFWKMILTSLVTIIIISCFLYPLASYA